MADCAYEDLISISSRYTPGIIASVSSNDIYVWSTPETNSKIEPWNIMVFLLPRYVPDIKRSCVPDLLCLELIPGIYPERRRGAELTNPRCEYHRLAASLRLWYRAPPPYPHSRKHSTPSLPLSAPPHRLPLPLAALQFLALPKWRPPLFMPRPPPKSTSSPEFVSRWPRSTRSGPLPSFSPNLPCASFFLFSDLRLNFPPFEFFLAPAMSWFSLLEIVICFDLLRRSGVRLVVLDVTFWIALL